MKQQVMMRWNSFSSKEKRLLIVLALVMLSLCFYAFIWLPVQHGRERLAKIIPEKQVKLMLMRSQAADIEHLRGQQNKLIRGASGALKAAVEVSAKFHGLIPSYNKSEQTSESQLSLTLTQVSFDSWIKWVESLQSQNHVRVKSCRIIPEGQSGQVRVEAVFAAFE